MQSLKEAKEELAAQEAEAAKAQEQQEPDTSDNTQGRQSEDDANQQDDSQDTVEGGDDTAQAAGDPEDWAKPDEEEDKDKPKGWTPDPGAKAAREKWRGRYREAKEEKDKLAEKVAELEAKLQSAVVAPAPGPVTGKPKREDFKTDAEHIEAVTRWTIQDETSRQRTAVTADTKKAERERLLKQVEEDTDAHYERASKLPGITPEAFKGADMNVRSAFDSIVPGQGDAFVDGLIHMIGPGSEKVLYKAGVSKAVLGKMVDLYKNDRSGLRLMAYIGELKAQYSAPAQRQTRAPDPVEPIQGDKSNTSSAAKQLRKEYDAAMNRGDAQAAWNVKKKAKGQKVDVAGW